MALVGPGHLALAGGRQPTLGDEIASLGSVSVRPTPHHTSTIATNKGDIGMDSLQTAIAIPKYLPVHVAQGDTVRATS